MDMRLNGKTAVVTGASRGIGLAIVSALTAEGMRVMAGARTVTPGLKETGAVAVPVDLSTPDGPALLVGAALAEFGEVDLLVNNVGGGDGGEGQTDGFLGFDDEQWRQAFDLNFLSAVRATRAALPSLLRSRGGIVNISSNGARMPHAGPVAYTTAKAALTAFGKALAEEFGPRGVRVNTVSPGPVRTAMWEDPAGYGAALARSMGLEHGQVLAQLPAWSGMTTGRLVEPAEVAALVVHLASPHAASVSGADYLIDGGAVKTV
ncbi:NAD(P)-dependent dehydrogenase (short-subunit alcohol dehydrogenase family) [Streptosporangium album]|uniref:NAD(P)-dependent dehydrogenase (Short-subunit alcohol dehydrogenase family) n=1 Tax=Streptosporangium album TaxID=47479 RepID=A0A7W7RZK0_9ACTN|nr:SDR family NAD(P)-dependent oxidoreductase [Streptosporangium album]MBB4940493.1 NAD(P)-dependent dehydrogenase (short-subunit alcohol dehydrogenase family) [Streptosporangium album]